MIAVTSAAGSTRFGFASHVSGLVTLKARSIVIAKAVGKCLRSGSKSCSPELESASASLFVNAEAMTNKLIGRMSALASEKD